MQSGVDGTSLLQVLGLLPCEPLNIELSIYVKIHCEDCGVTFPISQ